MRTISSLLVCFFMLITIQSVYAERITWLTNTAINDNWSDSLNWDLGRIPISTDSVMTFYTDVISLPNNYIAEINYLRLLGNLTIPANSELIFTNGQFDALGTVNNYGTIRVNNSPGEGIVCSTPAGNRPFNNYGNIYIDNSMSKGLVIGNGQVITNAAGALIKITNSEEESLTLGYPSQNGVLNNSGTIRLRDAVNGIGIKIEHDSSKLNNLVCGKIILLDQLVMSAGILDNAGFFKQNFDGDNDLGVVTNTTFNNHGLVEDRYASFDQNDFDIQSLWIKLIEQVQFKTGEKVSIFTVGASVGANAGDVFSDNLLTQDAGTYNLNTNTWVPNENANGKTTFYIRTSQQSNTCFDTVRFDLELPILAVNYWLGGTGAWQTAAKWSLGIVPDTNDIVAIYNANDEVGINNDTASAKKIFLGGKLRNTPSGVLNIGGVAGELGMDVQEGEIVNNGIINIYQSNLGIDIENGSLINNNLIKCTNTSACIEVASFTGFTASMINTGTIENTGGTLLISDETIVDNSGSLIGYNPFFESIRSDEMHNSGTIVIEGNGLNTGFNGGIKNMPSGVLTLKNLDVGGKLTGENEGIIKAELNNRGICIDEDLINKNGGQLTAINNATGLCIDNGLLTNASGAIISLDSNTQYGLHIKAPSIFQTTDLENEGLVDINETAGVGIYSGSDIKNQESGIIQVRASSSHGIHLYRTGAELENFDQGVIDIKDANGHGIFNEGASILNQDAAQIEIDSVGMSGIYFGDYFTGLATIYGGMSNYAYFEIGPNVVGDGIHLETDTYITNFECAGELISKSKIQLDGILYNSGIYRHLTSASSTIGINLQNFGLTYDPFVSLTSPNTWNQGIYIGEKTGTFGEGEIINDILEISATIPTGFELDTLWYLNQNLTLLAGEYDQSLNSFVPYGLAVDSSKFFFRVKNMNCSPAKLHKFSLLLENSINKVCGKILWEGGTGGFNSVEKWNKYRIPSACDSIIISGVLDSVLINADSLIEVLHISNRGYIFLNLGANLTVKDNTGNGVRNEGNILVRGTLLIDNMSENGFVGESNSELVNEGIITISDVMQRGLVLNNATFENTSTGFLLIEQALLEHIKLETGSLFNQEGVLMLNP